MAFLINCDNKGCGILGACELELETNEVICPSCDGIVKNVTIFAKTQLKSMKQIRQPKKVAGSVLCEICRTDQLPRLQGTQLLCPKCQTLHKNIPRAFENVIKGLISEKAKEDQEAQTEENRKAKKLPAPKPKALPKAKEETKE